MKTFALAFGHSMVQTTLSIVAFMLSFLGGLMLYLGAPIFTVLYLFRDIPFLGELALVSFAVGLIAKSIARMLRS